MTRGNTGPSVAKDQGIKHQARKSKGTQESALSALSPKK